MDNIEIAVRALVAQQVAPLIAELRSIRSQIDREAVIILLHKRERDAARADRDQRRAHVQCLLAQLRGVEDRVVRLAKERFPPMANISAYLSKHDTKMIVAEMCRTQSMIEEMIEVERALRS